MSGEDLFSSTVTTKMEDDAETVRQQNRLLLHGMAELHRTIAALQRDLSESNAQQHIINNELSETIERQRLSNDELGEIVERQRVEINEINLEIIDLKQDVKVSIYPIAKRILHEFFITVSKAMHSRNTSQSSARSYTLADLGRMTVAELSHFMNTCSQTSCAEAAKRFPSALQPRTTKSKEQEAKEQWIRDIADVDSPESIKSALSEIANALENTRISRNRAAHTMTLEQLRRHAVEHCSNSEKILYEAVLCRPMTDKLPDQLAGLIFNNGWHFDPSPSLDSLDME